MLGWAEVRDQKFKVWDDVFFHSYKCVNTGQAEHWTGPGWTDHMSMTRQKRSKEAKRVCTSLSPVSEHGPGAA